MSLSLLTLTSLLLLEPCRGLNRLGGGGRIPVTVYANTLLESNGVSTVPPIFGLR